MNTLWSGRAWIGRLAGPCVAHARAVAAFWVLAVVLGFTGAVGLPALLFSGSGDIPGSESQRVDALLHAQFLHPRTQLLVLSLRSPDLDRERGAATALFRSLYRLLRQSPLVADVVIEENLRDRRLLPGPGSGHIAIIALDAGTLREAEQAIPHLRAAVEPVLRAARARHPDLVWAMTGRAVLGYDLNRFNAEDTTRAEATALPLTLLILTLAFGSLAAAGLPLTLGLASTAVTLGIIGVAARYTVVSSLAQSVVSMLGLALGIDYSLFVVHRYRQQILQNGHEHAEVADVAMRRAAIVGAMGNAGPVVFASGLAVLIGMSGLLLTPLMETRSIGLGGCLMVAVAMLATFTLLPALLALLGNRVEWPLSLSRRLQGDGSRRRWQRWADAVMRHPLIGASLGLAVLLLLAWPGVYTRIGFPEGPFLPQQLEFRRGMDLLQTMQLKGLLSPLQIVLTDTAGGSALTSERVPALLDFTARLRADPRIAIVQGPFSLNDTWSAARYQRIYADIDEAYARLPVVRKYFVSRDTRHLLLQVIPRTDCTLEETKQLAREIPAQMTIAGLRIALGGQPVYYNDFDTAVKAAYGRSIGFVLLASCVVLMAVFRAPLVAAKALALNALSVLAGYGVVVFVFQLGHGSEWLGVGAPTEVVPLTIPLLIFCLLFGLSMDYEVFLLSGVREAYRLTGDNSASIRTALADSGAVITSAALIMVVVFGAFAFARVVLVQMLGLGLAVAVLVDATLIRTLLGPALMRIAGRWNWWPDRDATGQQSPDASRRS
jgi:RND superfamily putative drug exporter